ncbi:MAG: hypothetical protein AN483_06185 [Aphanizomenon flos-aquae MDT14a]|jgi:hypothetical protein|uniref:Uncharacterized protein n=1 Tax=Aphanizomenon flos-aquae LD13 TaxID=1710894 RepID=A0A1B7W0Z8_APHFL|nr:MAG: hypothetical protein AN481_02630 [Aphanizomenon flos-aquae LD13]OBQ30266.1 MAG: hypothetical protein AN483_06185 [Aphanizomenon flos-aquae MDT14a]HCQ23423.1 hypothetical protein [Anabaena sp. UBA12330]
MLLINLLKPRLLNGLAIAKHSLVIAVWGYGSAIAKRDLGIAVWGCGECDSEALLQAVRLLGM